jgi:activating signal cointegrator 1
MKTGSPSENILRCLSLTQPWATLVMIGAKRIETRSWRTSYRGPLGIHAAKGFPKVAREICLTEPFKRTLIVAGYRSVADLPFGALLGTVQLVAVVGVKRVRSAISSDEYAFGDYSDGRFAWILEDVRPLKTPIPIRGALGLWNIDRSLLEEVIA